MTRIASVTFLLCALLFNVIGSHAQPCLTELMPIGESDLLEIEKRWPEAHRVPSELRQIVATACGYADSSGTVPEELSVQEIVRCSLPGEVGSDTLIAFHIRSTEGDKDESIYLVVLRNSMIHSQSLVAQLQTTCEATYLSGCQLQEDGSILVQSLKHAFVCGTDEFLGTTQLPSYAVRILEDHTFEQILMDSKPGETE